MSTDDLLTPKRKGGRPKGGSLSINWNEVDRILVYGEKELKVSPTGVQTFEHRYPAYRDVAARFGISNARVGQYALEHNVPERKKLAQMQGRAEAEAAEVTPASRTAGTAARQRGSTAAEADVSDMSDVECRSEAEADTPEPRRGEGYGDDQSNLTPTVQEKAEGALGAGGTGSHEGTCNGNNSLAIDDEWEDIFADPKPAKPATVQVKRVEPEDPFAAIAPTAALVPVEKSEDECVPNNPVTSVYKSMAEREEKAANRKAGGQGLPVPKAVLDKLDELLVFGVKTRTADGGYEYIYPMGKEIAKTLGISEATVSLYRKQNLCEKRRQDIEAKRYAKDGYELTARLDKLDANGPNVDGTADQVLRVARKFLNRFERALDENRINITNVADLDRIVRLAQLVSGNADSRKEVKQVVSMDDLTKRFAMARQVEIEVSADMAGVIEDGELVED